MKILLSLSTSAHGSLGGLTFQGGSNCHTIVRAKSVPSHPKSHLQCVNQSIFNHVNDLYRNITPDNYQRLLAISNGLPPRQVFFQICMSHVYRNVRSGFFVYNYPIDIVYRDIPPRLLQVRPPAPGNTGFRIFLSIDVPASCQFLCWLSPAQSMSKNRYYGAYISTTFRSLFASGGGGISAYDFYGLIPNRVYFVKLRPIKIFTTPAPLKNEITTGEIYTLRAVSVAG